MRSAQCDPRGELIVALSRGDRDGNALLLRDRILQRNLELTPTLDRAGGAVMLMGGSGG